MRILLIEDDEKLSEALCCALRQEGYEVDACLDGQEGLYYMETGTADLVLLDRMLPGLSGTELLQQRRKAGDTTPVLMLTAMGTLSDRITGLDQGADDYLVKPFAMEELMARIRSLSRRGGGFHVVNDELAWGDLKLSESSCQLQGPDGECTLSRRECGLLCALLRHPKQTLGRSQLLLSVWGPDTEVEDGNLDNYIFFLRRRLRSLNSHVTIQTVRGGWDTGWRNSDPLAQKENLMNEQTLFRAVHRRLTFLCAAITASILCLFSCLYLYLAERTLQDNQQSAFRQDVSNLSRSLEQQAVITHAYLSSLEQNSSYQIYLWDHGLPFRFNEMPQHTLSAEVLNMLLSQLPPENIPTTNSASDTDGVHPVKEPNSPSASQKETSRLPSGEECHLLSSGESWSLLKLKTGQNQEYQVYLSRLSIGQPSAAQLLTGDQIAGVTLLVVSSPQDLQEKIWLQRLRFLLIDLVGILLLTLFASFFTKRMLRPLRESHDRQIRFVADASHELRTPLAVIRACMHAKPPAYEQTVDQECARMGRLIEDLLTLSRLETACGGDGLLPERQDVDLDTLLLTVYEQMELLAAQKNIRLSLRLPQESLPHIQGDRHKLEQLLGILLQNALSYTPAGGKVTLAAELTQSFQNRNAKRRQTNSGGASTVHIRVIDNGPGISDADKSHIFERFYQAQRSRTDRSHFGLGLCIAREIASSHGAVLTVEDTEGGGSTFSLVLKC